MLRHAYSYCIMSSNQDVREMETPPLNQHLSVSFSFDSKAYSKIQAYPNQESIQALKKMGFLEPMLEHDQCLDVGCGPGGFTRNYLLDYCRPCRRLVAVDKDISMVQRAREVSSHPHIKYDILDIESPDVTSFRNKHGKFKRVFSFFCFQFVKDNLAAYRNVAELLEPGGECVIVSCVNLVIADVWLEVYNTEKWKAYIPDPRVVFSRSFYFDQDKPAAEVEREMKSVVEEAGLQCVTFEAYYTEWLYSGLDAIVDFFVSIFNLEANIPSSEKDAFRNAWRSILEHKTTATPCGRKLKFRFSVLHARHNTTL